MTTLIGLNARINAGKLEALKGFGRPLATLTCAACGDDMWLDEAQVKGEKSPDLICNACIDQRLPPIGSVSGVSAGVSDEREPGDDREPLRAALRGIRFGPPAPAEDAPKRLDVAEAIVKARRAGAPWAELATAQSVIDGTAQPMRATVAAVAWYVRGPRTFPLFSMMGPTGLGKTTAAARVAIEFARDWPWNAQAGGGAVREPLVWLNAEDVAMLQAWMTDGKRQWDDALHAQVLVIDDAGHERERKGIDALTTLLLRRMDGRRATVLSTNLQGKPFVDRYGKPVSDRLKSRASVPDLGREESNR